MVKTLSLIIKILKVILIQVNRDKTTIKLYKTLTPIIKWLKHISENKDAIYSSKNIFNFNNKNSLTARRGSERLRH